MADDQGNVRDLDQQTIKAELAQIVWWSFEGAEPSMRRNGFSDTDISEQLLDAWKVEADTVRSTCPGSVPPASITTGPTLVLR